MTGDVDEHEVEVEVEVEDEAADEQLEREEHHEAAAEADDDVHAQAEAQPQPDEPIEDLDTDAGVAPEEGVADSLRSALTEMREEADRIAAMETGDEQVEAAERFAEAAGSLDEQVGSAARAAEADERD